jgi:molecular chaperone GrpE
MTDPAAPNPVDDGGELEAAGGADDLDALDDESVLEDVERQFARLDELAAEPDANDEPGDEPGGDPLAGYSSCEEALEDAVTSLERVTAERDDYLDTARRVQAEFENYRRRVEAQRAEQVARAAESLVMELLPVLDACDAALAHGASDVEPIHGTLLATLTKQGLARVDQAQVAFDPNQHEAVLSEPGDGDETGPVVVEVMRAGYLWNGRVLRPAMVKVRG